MQKYRKSYVALIITAIIIALLSGSLPAMADPGTIEVSQPERVTDSGYYERGQSIIYDGTDYWLFYGRSDSVTGNYDNTNPDVNDYKVYFKKAADVSGLASASPTLISGVASNANSYLGETGAAHFGGETWAFATIDTGDPTKKAELYGWWTSDGGATWNEVGPILSGLSTGQAHHDEIVFDGKLWVLEGSGNFTTMHSTTPKTGSWSTPLVVDASPSITGGLAHFFVDGSDLYLAAYSNGKNYIYKYNAGGPQWDKVDEVAPPEKYDPTLFKVGSTYVFVQAPWVSDGTPGGRQYLIAWANSTLDGSFFDGGPLAVTEGRYGTNSWIDMWPIGFTDDNGDSYLFYTSERDQPSAEGAGNIWYLKVDWDVERAHYTYIQEAIGAAGDNDTIQVHNGQYNESNITVGKRLTIQGETRTGVIIAPQAEDTGDIGTTFAGSYQHGFMVIADDVIIKNLTIDGSANNLANGGTLPNHYNFRVGILNYADGDEGYHRLRIEDVNVTHIRRRGIALYPGTTSGHIVTGCEIDGIEYQNAIMCAGYDVTISNNQINDAGNGISLFPTLGEADSGSFTVTNNTMTNIGAAPGRYYGTLWPVNAIYYRNPNYDKTVTITGNIIQNLGDGGIDMPGAIGMYIYNADAASLISNNTIDTTGVDDNWGIYLGGCAGTTVSSNNFTMDGSDSGIYLGRGHPTPGLVVPNVVTNNSFSATGSTSSWTPPTPGSRAEQVDGAAIVQSDDGYVFWMVENPYHTMNSITGNTIDGFAIGLLMLGNGHNGAAPQNVGASIGGNNPSDSNDIVNCGTAIRIVETDGATGGHLATATITRNSTSIHNNTIGIDVDGGAATIEHNTITDNVTGILIHNAGTATIQQNNISGNTSFGTNNTTGADIDARYNWWGDDSGPGDQGPGSGDGVSANVAYSPWLGNWPDTPSSNTFYA
ncbi:MAG: hypothetical protein JXB35_10590, partial [Anaerolineae bacterium]|nr:hypothetical protein [Anaerolineae bacterium]